MRSRRGSMICSLALLATAGCAKGKQVEGSAVTFGVGSASASAGPSSATNASDTGDDVTTDGATSSAEVGGENCGNGVVDVPEDCDGDDLAEESCATRGFSGGQLSCTASCVFDTALCSDACGNGIIDVGEDCDGKAPGSGDCESEGFAGGTLSCNPDCTYDTSACVDGVCGDGVLQDGETCDCADAACTPAQLGNLSCTALPAPSGGNYSGGTLGCVPTTCTLDESGCTACGNGIVDPGETCDGAQLAGQTCQSQGFDAGTLACSATCTFNTGSCVDWVCGNGSCEPNEDSCSCPSDCPDDPNTCGVPCQCGGSGGNCYCDQACLDFGDCCPNGPC